MRVDADARPERRPEARDRARRGREAARRILGVEPDLDRVAARAARGPSTGSGSPGGDAELLAHEVDPGHELA